ncbi:MAG: alpha/beta fold hydrolase [Pseudobdellovibrio sp.]
MKLNKFVPVVPLLTGHTQTVLGHLLPSDSFKIKFTDYILKLEDGDEILLEYFNNKSDHTISIYHGLAGDSQADYVRRSANLALALGWNIVLVNHRGASSKAKSKKTYHSGRGEDAGAVIFWARNQFPQSKQIALGFSMSGSILLNLLSYRYGSEQPDQAIVVNAPLNLASAAKLLTKGFSKIYDYRFYLILKKLIESREDISLPRLARTTDIDMIYTSKMNGFKDAADYYEKCSVLNYVDQIKTDTFILAAYDDPFIDIQDYLKAKWNGHAHLTLQKYGGHMGYVTKTKDPQYGHRWLDHYLGAVFEKIQTA